MSKRPAGAPPPEAKRTSGGQFAAGSSGNPAGRKPGSRNSTTILCQDLLAEDAAEIVAKLIERAKTGDAICLKLVIDRLVPIKAARDRVVKVDGLPALSKAADLVDAVAAVIARVADGELTLSEGREFLALLEFERRAIETLELTVKLEALEASLDPGDRAGSPAAGPGNDPDVAARIRRIGFVAQQRRPEPEVES